MPQAAPVESLLAGLEGRLAADPDDAKGWALLAQSYAFVGNFSAAENAVERAVALGFDGQELRTRVNVARREPASRDWIEQMIGADVR
jgi:cytochrome c-type biogenesis protein CcmH